MVPHTIPAATPYSERQLFESLETLDDDWTVVHGVQYFHRRAEDTGIDGEIDFVLLHPHYGGICVEVKGGQKVQVDDGNWSIENRYGRYELDRSPEQQARENKYRLIEKLKERTGFSPFLMHVVCLPNVVCDRPIGTLDRELIWDATDLADINGAIMRTITHVNPAPQGLSHSRLDQLMGVLAPTAELQSRLSVSVSNAVRAQRHLTEEQSRLMAMMRNINRLSIRGGAGTGKTWLALEGAQQAAAQGQRTLLLCYNRPLGQRLAADLASVPAVRVGSFHQIALDLLDSVGAVPDGERDQRWWDEHVPFALLDALDDIPDRFDAIFIDEGQDFLPEWVEVIAGLLDPDGADRLIMFSDPHQNIYRRDRRLDEGSLPASLIGAPVELQINCRNTKPVAIRAVAAIGQKSVTTRIVDSSVEPVAQAVPDLKAALEALRREVIRLVAHERLDPTDVVILSSSRALVDVIIGQRWGGQAIGDLDTVGVRASTIHRFKGLESTAVIVVEPPETRLDAPLAYIGFSRARAVLSVIGPESMFDTIAWPLTARA